MMMTLRLSPGNSLQKKLVRWLTEFKALERKHRRVVFGVWFLLGWYRFALAVFSLRRLCSSCCYHAGIASVTPSTLAQQEQALELGRLVAIASRVTPWKSQCLVQVLVVQRLLAAREIPGTIQLGVQLDASGPPDGQALTGRSGISAHAWLICGSEVVSGKKGHEEFSVISTLSWP